MTGSRAELTGNSLDDRAARVGHGVNRVAEADDDFLAGEPDAEIGLGFVGRAVTLLDFAGDLVGAAVLGSAQGADGAGDAPVEAGAGAGDDAGGEGGGIELVFGVEDQRAIEGADVPGCGSR